MCLITPCGLLFTLLCRTLIMPCPWRNTAQYLTYDDFVPLMDCVLKYHPGLEFLAETAEFQKKYAETVVLRIFYTLNR